MRKVGVSILVVLAGLHFCWVDGGMASQVVASEQPGMTNAPRAETAGRSQRELAKAVLSELGIAQRYDAYLANSVDIVVLPNASMRFTDWLQQVFAQYAGWNAIAESYITTLATNFSETELRSLLQMAKQPVMKKLLSAELSAYHQTTAKRRQVLFKVWDQYNSGQLNPPPGILP